MTPRPLLIALAGLLAGSAALAQVPPPPDGAGPAGPAAVGPRGAGPQAPVAPRPPAARAPLAADAATSVQGKVSQWLLNPQGEADGLLLADGTQVAFPPHLSAAVMQLVKVGDSVQVQGWRAPQTPVPVMRAQRLEAHGKSVVDQPPMPGARPPAPRDASALVAMAADGRIARLLYNDRGDVHGVVLADQSIVRFPPHIGAASAAMLQPGGTLYARGWGTRGDAGSVLEATALGSRADNVQDVTGFGPPPPAAGPAGPRAEGPAGPRPARGPESRRAGPDAPRPPAPLNPPPQSQPQLQPQPANS